MDLSWCIICDRHSVDNNLYCSESCRFQDSGEPINYKKPSIMHPSPNNFLITPPTSPEIAPFLYPVQETRRSSGIRCTGYQYFPASPPELSIYCEDT
ncbi:hypothetical protein BY458DRAFT_519805 [Sporodiniella umbellata]|nr:hypothetical protein BY458DRAFT_519805 [Sporodiniella umbellata]